MRRALVVLAYLCVGLTAMLTIAGTASAGAIRPLAGCTANVLPRNDDGSTGRIDLGFGINFYGVTYPSVYVNNNGNVTFSGPMSTYTPFPIVTTGVPIIAPFFGDVDTRNVASGVTTYGPVMIGTQPGFCVSWDGVGVGYYRMRVDKLNKFQLLIVGRDDVGAGDFDIEFNYDQIQWETGEASGGSGGLGGNSARWGFSNGNRADPSQSFEGPGSAVNGALLDSAPTGLANTSTNSIVTGRHFFPVRNGAAPEPGQIEGRVLAPGDVPQAGAPVEVCNGPVCWVGFTNSSGAYHAVGLGDGDWVVRAFPPAGSTLMPGETAATLPDGGGSHHLLGVDVHLIGPVPPPPGTGIEPSHGGGGGVPVVYWGDPLTLTTTGCTGGTASYEIVLSDGPPPVTGPMTEGPAGVYTGSVPAFYPRHGDALITITIHCPGGSTETVIFPIYIDPSGLVKDTLGNPVAGATVTLYRSDTGTPGSFAPVPDGSAIMSPSNRTNPVLTDAAGHFGWDVISGFYVVRAELAGCTAPGGGAFVETAILTIPPPALGLELVLDCPLSDTTAPVASPAQSPAANRAGWNDSDVTVSWNWADETGGSGIDAGRCTTSSVSSGEGVIVLSATCDDLAGNTGSATYTVKVDKTDPEITGSRAPLANANGWNDTDVTVSFTCADTAGGSGIATDTVAGDTVTANGAGQSVTNTGVCVDMAGNAAAPATVTGINIDKVDPAITGSRAPLANAFGWNKTNVTVSFTCADNVGGSGIDTDTVAGATLTTSGAGQSVTNTGVCVDMAGNAAAPATVAGINIDKVDPVLTPTVSPNPVALNGAAVASANATDALSGVDTFGCGAVDTSAIGPGTVSCTATDKAGNSATATASYLVTVRASKQAVLAEITAELATAGKRDRSELREAAKQLRESLDADLWIDGNHLRARHGGEVFESEKQAVEKLEQLLRDRKSGVADATLNGWIDTLVTVDRALARIAIDEARAAAGDARRLAEAEKEMAKAASALAKGQQHEAIEHYKNAWKKARKSTEHGDD